MKIALMILTTMSLMACGTASKSNLGSDADQVLQPQRISNYNLYYYNDQTGQCVDALGDEGLNQVNIGLLFANPISTGGINFRYYNVNAECADLRNTNFAEYIGERYDELVQWNLRGAAFSGSQFLFANMRQVDLSGAQMEGLIVGYTRLLGVTFDQFTALPSTMHCNYLDSYTADCVQ